ncbi:hypothetical protein [uncultured Hoeflea sp.]|uniref:hypothetical protein n=1 Tax=uncultured Hoeflea sp. TaxID=538666 RepID=UPI0026245529|nr:hypothetical protein [uncultured Hoeflea sp.]
MTTIWELESGSARTLPMALPDGRLPECGRFHPPVNRSKLPQTNRQLKGSSHAAAQDHH